MGYREFAPRPELSDIVACTWERTVPPSGAPRVRILPDGCSDLMLRAGELIVAGPDLGPQMSGPPPGSTVVGLRFRPGVAGAALGWPAHELRDARVSVFDLWGRAGDELAERAALAGGPAAARAALEASVLARRADTEAPDPLVLAAADVLARPGARVDAIARDAAISERQLRRRFDAAVGYGPKALARILRLQRFLALARRSRAGGLARLAADAGYADQAHLSRECARLGGAPPSRLVRPLA